MSHVQKGLLAIAVALGLSAMFVAPAQSLPNNRVEVIRGQGSDTTYDLMQNLDRFFNSNTTPAGCNVLSTPQRLDHECGVAGPPFGATGKNANWDHDVAMSFNPLGSSNGIRMLTNFGQPGNARIDYARASRGPSGSDNAGLRFVAYARDALTWVNFRGDVDTATCDVDRSNAGFPEFDDDGPLTPVDPNDGTWPDGPDAGVCNDATVASSVSNLTNTQITDINVNCTITTWNQLDASKPSTPILVWTSQAGSGTRPSWDGFVGGNSDNCITNPDFKDGDFGNGERVIFEHDATPIVECKSNGSCPASSEHYTHSIFHYGFGAHSASETEPLGQGADLGSINGVAPSPATIAEGGGFLYARNVYNVYRFDFATNNAPSYVTDYIGEQGFVCKNASNHEISPKTGNNFRTDVEAVISKTGFVPIDDGATGVGGNSHCRVTDL